MPLNHISELTEEQFNILGKVLVEWSNIEFLLSQILSRLLITPPYLALTYTDRMTGHQIQEAIFNAIKIHKKRYRCKLVEEETLDEIKRINQEVEAIRSLRNKFAHSSWARKNDNEIFGTGFSGKFKDPKKKNKDSYTFTLKELKEFYNQAYETVEQLSEIAENLPELKEENLSQKLEFKT